MVPNTLSVSCDDTHLSSSVITETEAEGSGVQDLSPGLHQHGEFKPSFEGLQRSRLKMRAQKQRKEGAGLRDGQASSAASASRRDVPVVTLPC